MKQIVILHGYGANADDLKPLEGFLRNNKEDKFFFPEAPIQLAPAFMMNARAWFDIDEQRLMNYQQTGEAFDLTHEVPEKLEQAMDYVKGYLDSHIDPDLPLIMGGFSQGAMCTLHFYSRFVEHYHFSGLVFLSGNLLALSRLEPEKINALESVPVFQSHGRQDSVLPYQGATNLQQFFEDNGNEVDFNPFEGGHEIPMPILSNLKNFLIRL